MENKMTNVKALNYVLENCDLPDDMRDKVSKILASMQKKADTRKPTGLSDEKLAQANEIVEHMEHGVEYTTTEIRNITPSLDGKNTQYVAPLMKYLAEQGTVIRTDGRTSKYRLAN